MTADTELLIYGLGGGMVDAKRLRLSTGEVGQMQSGNRSAGVAPLNSKAVQVRILSKPIGNTW